MQQNAKACRGFGEPSTPVLCVGSILTAVSPIAEERSIRHKVDEDRPWDPSTKIFETVSPNDLIPMNEPTAEGREGFQVYAVKHMLPKDLAALDPATRRELMICDLFVTEKLTISEIVGVLDGEDQKSVILTLIKRRVLQDRRKQQRL
jgi:hypothetical protein